ncbi:MAG: hypothetical protein WCT31_05705, partial [Candidatus Micrarchaeia archaeon]
ICPMRQTMNSTEFKQFERAVDAGDYQTAKELHEEYGLGGAIFDRLNETTFPDYSQIHILSKKLKSELGRDAESAIENGRERSVPGFEHGMRGRYCLNANSTAMG